jgi:hypothetical protein
MLFERVDFLRRYPAMHMRAHILRLGRRRVIHVATNVAVIIFRFDLLDRNNTGITGHILAPAIDIDDLRHVLRPQEVLRLALTIFAVCIDEENILALRRMLLVHHQDAGRNTSPIEQARG